MQYADDRRRSSDVPSRRDHRGTIDSHIAAVLSTFTLCPQNEVNQKFVCCTFNSC